MALFRSVENCRSLHILVSALIGLGKKSSREILRKKIEVESCSHKLHRLQKKYDFNVEQKTSGRE